MNFLRLGSKQAYIFNNNTGVSYNTPIVYSTGGVSFYTSSWYSVTTAHHKSEFLRFFNNARSVEVNQAALIDLNQDLEPAAVIKEDELKTGIINAVEEGTWIYKNKEAAPYLELVKESKTQYKNGNFQEVRTYKTNFKYVSSLQVKQTQHAFRTKRPAYNGPTGPKESTIYYKYKTRSVINY